LCANVKEGVAAIGGYEGDRVMRIEKAFGVKMDTMMRMGAVDEIARMGKREGLIRVPLAVGQTR